MLAWIAHHLGGRAAHCQMHRKTLTKTPGAWHIRYALLYISLAWQLADIKSSQGSRSYLHTDSGASQQARLLPLPV